QRPLPRSPCLSTNIPLDALNASPKDLPYVEEVEELNTRLGRGGARDYRLPTGLTVDVTHYRAGLEVFFHGVLHAQVLGSCARCLEEYAFGLDYPFAFVLMPRVAAGPRPSTLSEEDLALSYYGSGEFSLTPLVPEQTIIQTHTRPLSR